MCYHYCHYIIDHYKPKARRGHSTIVIGNRLYSWGGQQDGLPEVHDSEDKIVFLSNVDVLHLDTGIWHNEPTTGDPHLGVAGYASTAIKTKFLFFGGWCGHGYCCHNSISQLDLDTLMWSKLVGNDHQRDGPMKKCDCGMISFASEGEHCLLVIGGFGPPPDNPQPNAQYNKGGPLSGVRTNEQHIFNISTGKL